MTVYNKVTTHIKKGQNDRLIRELEHDPYHSKRKIAQPTACPNCGAIYKKGRWIWGEAPVGAHEQLCPACHRIQDKVPAAFLTLRGKFLAAHREEIINLIQNYVQRENAEHPLKRIINIEDQVEETIITFTDAHLAHGIGEAIHHAYEGKIDYKYTKEDILLRVTWTR